MNNKLSIKNMVVTALFIALIFLATYSLKIPLGVGGYIHLGDAFILLCAAFLPFPYSAASAGLGSTIADIAAGYTIYAPFTFVIKFCMALLISSKLKKIVNLRNFFFAVIAELIMVTGYYFTDVLLYKNFISPIEVIPMNLIQGLSGVIIFVIAGIIFDRTKLKQKI